MTDCCEAAASRRQRLVTPVTDNAFIVVDDDDVDAVSRTMSFRRCPAVRGRRHRRSFAAQRPSSTDGVPTVYRVRGTTSTNPADGKTPRLVAWSSGRASVFGQRAFAVLRSTCSMMGDHLCR